MADQETSWWDDATGAVGSIWDSFSNTVMGQSAPSNTLNTNQERPIPEKSDTGNSVLDMLGFVGGTYVSNWLYGNVYENNQEKLMKEQELGTDQTSEYTSSPLNLTDSFKSANFGVGSLIALAGVGLGVFLLIRK